MLVKISYLKALNNCIRLGRVIKQVSLYNFFLYRIYQAIIKINCKFYPITHPEFYSLFTQQTKEDEKI